MVAFTSVQDLKAEILSRTPEDFFDSFILQRHTEYFAADGMTYVSEVLSNAYGIEVPQEDMVVVGSSKLGFATHDKFRNGEVIALAYRAFGDDSDIDLSIYNPSLFSTLWHEISHFYNQQSIMPYRYKKLQDYLAYGWLRSDHLPVAAAPHLVKCSNLRNVRGIIRRNRQRGHPMLDIGIFYDLEHLRMYQVRSINVCRRKLEAPL